MCLSILMMMGASFSRSVASTCTMSLKDQVSNPIEVLEGKVLAASLMSCPEMGLTVSSVSSIARCLALSTQRLVRVRASA